MVKEQEDKPSCTNDGDNLLIIQTPLWLLFLKKNDMTLSELHNAGIANANVNYKISNVKIDFSNEILSV